MEMIDSGARLTLPDGFTRTNPDVPAGPFDYAPGPDPQDHAPQSVRHRKAAADRQDFPLALRPVFHARPASPFRRTEPARLFPLSKVCSCDTGRRVQVQDLPAGKPDLIARTVYADLLPY